MFPIQQHASRNRIQQGQTKPFLHRTHKLSFIFAALFVCYSSHSRLRDSQLRPCNDFLLFFTTQTRPVHRETDNGYKKYLSTCAYPNKRPVSCNWNHRVRQHIMCCTNGHPHFLPTYFIPILPPFHLLLV